MSNTTGAHDPSAPSGHLPALRAGRKARDGVFAEHFGDHRAAGLTAAVRTPFTVHKI